MCSTTPSLMKITDFHVPKRFFFPDGDKACFIHMADNEVYISLLNVFYKMRISFIFARYVVFKKAYTSKR